MDRACSMHGRDEKCIWLENLKGRDHLEGNSKGKVGRVL
jgi:hypothetical protein